MFTRIDDIIKAIESLKDCEEIATDISDIITEAYSKIIDLKDKHTLDYWYSASYEVILDDLRATMPIRKTPILNGVAYSLTTSKGEEPYLKIKGEKIKDFIKATPHK